MRVAINAQLLSFAQNYRSGGISRVIYHLLRELSQMSTNDRFVAFVPGLPSDDELTRSEVLDLRPSRLPTERPAVRIAWEQLAQPLLLSRERATIHHSLSYALPLGWRGPSVLTIYDLSFIRYPRFFNRGNRLYKTLLTSLSARRANRVITISEHGKREVVDLLRVPEKRVTVAYPGVDDRFRPLPAAEVQAFRARLGLPERFILFLGTLEPRKNAVGLVRAYARLREETGLPLRLVLAGGTGWRTSPLNAVVQELGLQDQVIFPGYVSSEDQVLWYNAADVLAYPSLYEGFGLPPLEAMACGVPVVASNTSSIPEVVGEAGVLVDPFDSEALASALHTVLADTALRDRLRGAGPLQASAFQWENMARRTVGVYHSLASGGL